MMMFNALMVSLICGAFAALYIIGFINIYNAASTEEGEGMIPGLDGLAYFFLIAFFSISSLLLAAAFYFVNSLIVASVIALAAALLIFRRGVKNTFLWLTRERGRDFIRVATITYTRTEFVREISLMTAVFILFQLVSLIVCLLKAFDFSFLIR